MVRGETDKSTRLVAVSSQDTGNRELNILPAPKMEPSLAEGKEAVLAASPGEARLMSSQNGLQQSPAPWPPIPEVILGHPKF